MHLLLINILGWLGAISLLTAYAALHIRIFAGLKKFDGLLNAFGSFLLTMVAYDTKVYPFLVINTFWLIITLKNMYTYGRRRDT